MKKSVRSNDIRYFTNYRGKTFRVALVEGYKLDGLGYCRVVRCKDGQETLIHHSNLSRTKPNMKITNGYLTKPIDQYSLTDLRRLARSVNIRGSESNRINRYIESMKAKSGQTICEHGNSEPLTCKLCQ